MRQWGVNNLPKVVAQQHHGRGSKLRPLDRKSDALPPSHRAKNQYNKFHSQTLKYTPYFSLDAG